MLRDGSLKIDETPIKFDSNGKILKIENQRDSNELLLVKQKIRAMRWPFIVVHQSKNKITIINCFKKNNVIELEYCKVEENASMFNMQITSNQMLFIIDMIGTTFRITMIDLS